MESKVCLMILVVGLIIMVKPNSSEGVGTIVVNGTKEIGKTDEHFVCFTMDMWTADMCRWNHCAWGGQSSVLTMNLSEPLLVKTLRALKPVRIRVGGTLQDKLIYDVGSYEGHCSPFQVIKDRLFGYSQGCLYMNRWDELNKFFTDTRAIVTFGLNALLGRHKTGVGEEWGGEWDYSNAEALIKYTSERNYKIDSWELGNELSGKGIHASIGVQPYAKDLIKLREIIDRYYKKNNNSKSKRRRRRSKRPSIIAPGGFFDPSWFAQLLNYSGYGVLDALSHHIYNLGAGEDSQLIHKILDPTYLNQVSNTFYKLEKIIETQGPWSTAWVGEAGGAFGSGGPQVSNAFVGSFWYMDNLAMAAMYSTKVYCRQALIGGFYGVLNATTMIPTPDYYSALLFRKFMGARVLKVDHNVSTYLRAYAHCSRKKPGVTLLLINLTNQTDFTINVQNANEINLQQSRFSSSSSLSSSKPNPKSEVSKEGRSELSSKRRKLDVREEYHLTPKDGDLRSSTMLVNGYPMEITEEGDLPSFEPVFHHSNTPIHINRWSIAFIVIHDFEAQACT